LVILVALPRRDWRLILERMLFSGDD
jgi:hypothetical protein